MNFFVHAEHGLNLCVCKEERMNVSISLVKDISLAFRSHRSFGRWLKNVVDWTGRRGWIRARNVKRVCFVAEILILMNASIITAKRGEEEGRSVQIAGNDNSSISASIYE